MSTAGLSFVKAMPQISSASASSQSSFVGDLLTFRDTSTRSDSPSVPWFGGLMARIITEMM